MKCDIKAIAAREKPYMLKRKQKCGQMCLLMIALFCLTNLSGPHKFDSFIYGSGLLFLGFYLGAYCEIGTYLWAVDKVTSKNNWKRK
jgi:hypothetical protein